jgi:hypothetical protein
MVRQPAAEVDCESTKAAPRPVFDKVIPIGRGSSCEWAKLINKLRRVGLESQAQRLQMAVNTLPPGERWGLPAEAFTADSQET